jgi:exopolysaccharide biosynthesis protein
MPTQMTIFDVMPIENNKRLRLHDGKYATKDQFKEDYEKTWERKALMRIMRLEAEKEIDRRKIEGMGRWLRIIMEENNKLKKRL